MWQPTLHNPVVESPIAWTRYGWRARICPTRRGATAHGKKQSRSLENTASRACRNCAEDKEQTVELFSLGSTEQLPQISSTSDCSVILQFYLVADTLSRPQASLCEDPTPHLEFNQPKCPELPSPHQLLLYTFKTCLLSRPLTSHLDRTQCTCPHNFKGTRWGQLVRGGVSALSPWKYVIN